MRIRASKRDVLWNYIGTIVSMTSGFILTPLLLMFLTEEEIGLWYIFVAISNFTVLFEFGFNPTFARNIVYCVSGASSMAREGRPELSREGSVDMDLLSRLMRSCKIVYAVISIAALLLLLLAGTPYIGYVAATLPGESYWPAWAVIVISVFINLYFLYVQTFLRGFGDIEGENRARVFSRVVQLVVSGVLLALGWGLISASIGLLANGVVLRVYASIRLNRNSLARQARSSGLELPRSEVMETVGSVWHIAWRDGVVQLSGFASGQAMSIVCSLFIGLAETGVYSLSAQFAGAVTSFASAFIKSYYPAFQSAYVRRDTGEMRSIMDRGIAIYYIVAVIGTAGVALFILPLAPLIKPGYIIDLPFFLFITLYNFLSSQYGIFCNLIVSTNRIPYVWGYLISGVASIALACAFGVAGIAGMWGITASQIVVQCAYNVWKWPRFVTRELGTTLFRSVAEGLRYWISWARCHVVSKADGRQ